MPVTDVQETCTTNLYKLTGKRNLYVYHTDLQQLAVRFFLCKFLARNRTRSI